jgi:hypothetical protein
MKYRIVRSTVFVFGMLLIMVSFQSGCSGWWQTYSDPDGDFSLKFPSKPQATERQVKLDTGGTAVMKMIAATPDKATLYIFTYYHGPGSAGKTIEEALNGARDGFISGAHGALLDEQRIQIDGHQGRDIQARSATGSVFNTRFIADEQRMIMLSVETAAGLKADSKSVQKFFSSLKLSH